MRCDRLFPSDVTATYVNDHLKQQSFIDYVTTSSPAYLLAFNVLEPDIISQITCPYLYLFVIMLALMRLLK